ncbi:MAG: methylmalonyl-CoA mutase, partial [Thermoanaerobaculia bacterium]|nr:methylmalonyl-CoA mutase [Thermoanaerobaculia bacterium]
MTSPEIPPARTESEPAAGAAASEAPRPDLAEARARWERERSRAEAQRPPWRRDFTTVSGLEVPPLVTPEEVAGLDPARHLGVPGEFPYTRGIHPTGYRGKLWTMRQFAGFG